MGTKKTLRIILIGISAILVILVMIFCGYYYTRFRTIGSLEKLTEYEDGYDLYKIDIRYDYDLDRMTGRPLRRKQWICSGAMICIPLHREIIISSSRMLRETAG